MNFLVMDFVVNVFSFKRMYAVSYKQAHIYYSISTRVILLGKGFRKFVLLAMLK